jgi:hypothetical protein
LRLLSTGERERVAGDGGRVAGTTSHVLPSMAVARCDLKYRRSEQGDVLTTVKEGVAGKTGFAGVVRTASVAGVCDEEGSCS